MFEDVSISTNKNPKTIFNQMQPRLQPTLEVKIQEPWENFFQDTLLILGKNWSLCLASLKTFPSISEKQMKVTTLWLILVKKKTKSILRKDICFWKNTKRSQIDDSCGENSEEFRAIVSERLKQDGQLAPANLLPNYTKTDQFLQTVINKTSVLILVHKEFIQINFTTDYCTLCKRVSRVPLEKFVSHSAEKPRRGNLQFFRKFLLSKKVRDRRRGYQDCPSRTFCLSIPKNFVREPFSVSLISGVETLYNYEGNIIEDFL